MYEFTIFVRTDAVEKLADIHNSLGKALHNNLEPEDFFITRPRVHHHCWEEDHSCSQERAREAHLTCDDCKLDIPYPIVSDGDYIEATTGLAFTDPLRTAPDFDPFAEGLATTEPLPTDYEPQPSFLEECVEGLFAFVCALPRAAGELLREKKK